MRVLKTQARGIVIVIDIVIVIVVIGQEDWGTVWTVAHSDPRRLKEREDKKRTRRAGTPGKVGEHRYRGGEPRWRGAKDGSFTGKSPNHRPPPEHCNLLSVARHD